jgi:hypothetical protein
MNKEKKGALKNILSDLFVSKYSGDIVPSSTFKDVGVLFKRREYEDEVIPHYEEVTGVKKERVQRRYSQLRNKKNLERYANEILKTLLDIRLFDYNKDLYKDSLNEYRSIVEARRHKEVMSVFKDAIGTNRLLKKIDYTPENKSNMPLLLGGLAVGAVGLLAFKSYAKEIEELFDEKGLNLELDEVNEITKEFQATETELNLIEKQFSEIEIDETEIQELEEAQEELPEENFSELEKELITLQQEIKKDEGVVESGVSRAASRQVTPTMETGAATAASTQVTPVEETGITPTVTSRQVTPTMETGVSRTTSTQVTPTMETGVSRTTSTQVTPTMETGVATATSRQVTPTMETGVATATSRQVTPTMETGVATATSRQVTPVEETGMATASSRLQTPFEETGVSRATSTQVTPFEETGVSRATSTQVTPIIESGVSRATSTQVTPFEETGMATAASRQVTPVEETGVSRATSTQVTPTMETGVATAASRNRMRFARLRPDESAVQEISPSVTFGGFPYKPTVAEEKPTSTVARISKLENIDELKRKIGRAEGGEKIGYNAINVPVIRNPNEYDRATRGKIYTQLFKEAEILRGNIDATTGKKFDKNLSEMTMEEVIALGKRRLEHYKSFQFDGKKVDLAISSASGQFGFTMAAIEDNASKLFGVNWKKEPYSSENQEKMQSFLMKTNIIRFENQNLPISEAFLYMKHFFGPFSDKPLRILNAKDEEKMSDIMSISQKKSNPTQAAMTVKQYKEHLMQKGFSFDIIDTKKLITEEERRAINLKPVKTTSDIKSETNTGQRINTSSAENIDSKRETARRNIVVVQQNNNNTVVNKRTVTRPVNTQPNNNPGLR